MIAKWRQSSVVGVTMAAVALLFGGCTVGGGSGGIGGQGNNSSLITSIENIDADDRAREEIRYVLECDGDKTLTAKQIDGTKILFDGKNLEDGKDKCAMLVYAKVDPAEGLIWTSKPETPGLYYGSNKQTVQNRKLTLTLYKTYKEPTAGPTFDLTLKVKFNLASGDEMPVAATTTAVLQCGDESVNEVEYKNTGADSKATLTFRNNSLEKLKDKTCTDLTVLEKGDAGNPVATYEAKNLGIKLEDAKAGETLTLPKEEDQFYTLEAKSDGGDVGVDILKGKCFLPYDREESECPDVRESAPFPYAKSYVFAEVKGKTNAGEGEEKTYIVAFGDGVRFANSDTLNLVQLNKVLSEADAEANVGYTFYQEGARETLLGATLASEQVDGSALSGAKVTLAEAKETLFLHIRKVWVHGFKEIAAADLNSMAEAHWYGIVTAKKTGENEQRFLVTGADQFFFSAEKAADSGEAFFAYDDMIANLKDLGADEKWGLYTYKGGPLERTGCELALTDFGTALSQKHAGTLKEVQKDFLSCAHSRLTLNDAPIDETWEASVTYYKFGWYRLEN